MPLRRFGTCSSVLLVPIALVAIGVDGWSPSAIAPRAEASSTVQSTDARAGAVPASRTRPSRKKGVSLWPSRGVNRSLRLSGARWFWNWDTSHPGVRPSPGTEFVPMMWGAGSVTPERTAAAKSNGKTLLGFNEPDHDDQSDMTVEEASTCGPSWTPRACD